MKLLAAVTSIALVLGACASTVPVETQIAERAALIETTACGDTSSTDGSAVIVDRDLVLASAHVVIGATDVYVDKDGDRQAARIVAIDRRSDLALLEVDRALDADPLELATVAAESEVLIGNTAADRVRPVVVTRRAEIRIEEVRSTVRSARHGFEIDERVELGESGSGVYNADGQLVGVIFGRSTLNADRSFAVNHEEVQIILDAERSTFQCNPESHIVEAVG